MKFKLAIAILFISGTIVKANVDNSTLGITSDSDILNEYINLDKQLRRLADRGVKRMLPFALRVAEYAKISPTCQDNLFQLLNGFRKLTDWSINYIDAIGKPQSGMLIGNLQMYGEYKQCFDTVVQKRDKTEFRGQYCGVMIKPIMPYIETVRLNSEFKELTSFAKNSSGLMKIIVDRLTAISVLDPKIGVCVPSGCTKDDISRLFKYLSEQVSFLNATVAYCFKEEDLIYWTGERITVACVFAFLGMMVLIGTIVDSFAKKKENYNLGLVTKILQCFSITRNFPKLMNTDTSEGTITCFAGIRVLSLFWIILCHEYLMQGSALVSNHALFVLEFLTGFFSQIVLNGFTSTEIFFFIAGFVNCYTRLKHNQRGKPQPSILKIIIHRLWRIYPTYITGFFIFVLLSATNAQLHAHAIVDKDICRKTWWKNILFVNNFYGLTETCIGHTWYVAVDMQLFLFSLITVPVFFKKEKLGVYLHSGIVILASIGCFIQWWIKDLPPSPLNVTYLNKSDASEIGKPYTNTLLHIPSYYIGILIGYMIANKKEKKFSKITLALGWLTASFFYLCVLFLTYRWNFGTPYTKFESSAYGAFSKPILILCVSWMVYCCKTGQGGFVNYFLSLKLWIPLSRLTYMLYMISVILQFFYNSNVNFPPDFATIYLVWSYFGNLSIGLLISLVLVLIVESPFLALEKILFRRNPEEKKPPSEFQKDVIINGKKDIVLDENPKIKAIEI